MKCAPLYAILALLCGCAYRPVAPTPVPAPINFDPPPLVWSSLHDEFAEEVQGSKAWLKAPATGLEPKFLLHGGRLQELCGDLGLPKADVVVPLDEEARLRVLALLRDDTPTKVLSRTAATLDEAQRVFTVTVVFEQREYRYTIDPVFGFVDVIIGGQPVLYSENLPLAEKFVELYARQMHDERIKAAIVEARRRFYPPETK